MIKNKKIFSRLLEYTKAFKLIFVFAIIGHLLFIGMDFLFLTSFEKVIDSLNNLDSNSKESLSNLSFLKWMPVYILAIVLIRGIAGFVSSYCMSWIGQSIVQKMREQLIENYINNPTSFFDNNTSGQLVSKVTYNAQQVADTSTEALTKLVRDGGMLIFLLGFLFYKDWRLSLIFCVFVPVIAIIVRIATNRFKIVSKNIQSSMGDITQTTQEIINGQKTIKAHNGKDFEIKRFSTQADNNRIQEIKLNVAQAISTPVIQLIASLSIAGVVFIASNFIADGSLSPSEFVGMLIVMMAILKPLKSLSNLNQTMQKGLVAAKSVFDVIDELKEKDSGYCILKNEPKNISFNNIYFTYPNTNKKVLKNISFNIKENSTVALVGKSGSGKSTLADLFLRFYELNSGEIKIDDTNINAFTTSSLRDNIALVSQDVTLFNDTIAKNIAYGEECANQTRLLESIIQANAIEFIDKLEGGLNFIVGENGTKLSGGQRQRISIARAIYKNTPIIILDEATSALDNESERHIQSALESLTKNRTTLVIAHRLSTIENADNIIVLEDGEIIEQGNHNSLLDLNKKYSKLYLNQFND
jgi:subfamily B ATP-binding cassette protein MsbA